MRPLRIVFRYNKILLAKIMIGTDADHSAKSYLTSHHLSSVEGTDKFKLCSLHLQP